MRCLAAAGLMLMLAPFMPAADPPARELMVVDHRGKDVTLKNWQLTAGTRRLEWLAPAAAKADQGPRCLEFREEQSTAFQNGILTLVPLTSVRSLDYDDAKKVVVLTYTGPGDKEAKLTGSTMYLGINRLAIEGEADLGDLGVATVKFLGGDGKQGVRGVRFPSAQPLPAATGPSAIVQAQDKEHSKHVVHDLQVLYRTKDGQRTLSYLMFKKTVKIDLVKIQKLRHIEADDKKQASLDYEVTLADGTSHTLTLMEKITVGKDPAALVGLVGRVPAGYQLFPPHTIAELTWGKTGQ